MPKIRPYRFLNYLITLLLFVSCGEAQYTIFHGGPILTMDQDFKSRADLCVIVKGEKMGPEPVIKGLWVVTALVTVVVLLVALFW